jgi:hypothetical protein
LVDEERDAEACYRRGFAHGAKEVISAVAAMLPNEAAAKLQRWLDDDLAEWRSANLQGLDSTRHHTPHLDPKSLQG